MNKLRQRLSTDWPFIVSGTVLGLLAILVIKAWAGR